MPKKSQTQPTAAGRIVVFVDETCLETEGYRPKMVVEGEPGYHKQGDDDWQTNPRSRRPWFWGHDLAAAQRNAKDHNAKMGISPDEALEIIAASMLASSKKPARGRK